jgi:hypothetical protein
MRKLLYLIENTCCCVYTRNCNLDIGESLITAICGYVWSPIQLSGDPKRQDMAYNSQHVVTKVYPVNRKGTLMNREDKRRMTYPLRLAASLRDVASQLAQTDGVSLNHLISLAVAEKISRLESETLNEQKLLIRRQKMTLASGVISSTLYRS